MAKEELTQQLESAKSSGSFMVAIWKIKNGKMNLYRLTDNFPVSELETALDLLNSNLEPLMEEDEEILTIPDSVSE